MTVGQAVTGVIQVGVGGWDGILLLPEVVETIAVLVETGERLCTKDRDVDSDGEPMHAAAGSCNGGVRETESGFGASFHAVECLSAIVC